FETCFPNKTCSLSRATNKDFAAGLVDGYVSVMTCAKISGVRRLRMDEMDRRARRENLASNNITARSSNGKLLLMSAMKHFMSVFASGRNNGDIRTRYGFGHRIDLDCAIIFSCLLRTIHGYIAIIILQ